MRRHAVPYTGLPGEEGPRRIDSKQVSSYRSSTISIGTTDIISMATTRHITMWDLNVGKEVCVYGKVVRPVACDSFTRHFLICQVPMH